MINLSPSQLLKPYHSNHELYGLYQDRGERFLEKIEKQEPFELTDGSSSIILKNSPGVKSLMEKNYNELSGGKKLFVKEDGELISLSNFVKTEEFGSSKGTGSGSKNTSLQESTQCVFNAMLESLKKTYLDVEDITYDNMSGSLNKVDVNDSFDEIYEFSQIPSWQQSFLTSSNLLSQYLEEMDYIHHKGSEFVNKIYTAYKDTDLGIAKDKWNPSDIWMVKEDIYDVEFSSSIYELNQQLEDLYNDKKLIGVSLKKLGKDSVIIPKNFNDSPKNIYIYEGYKTTNKSKDIKLISNEYCITFRTFNWATNWAGEINGKTASHGKIGLTPLNEILKKFGYGIESPKFYVNLIKNQPYVFLSSLKVLTDKYMDISEFDIFIQDKSLDWKVSKFIGLKLISIFNNLSMDLKNELITEILNYSSSESSISSVHLKIS